MPNAKEIKHKTPRILAYGDAGCGKTTQFLTLPGKKFAYLFDPNAQESLAGFDLDYEAFFPEDLSMALTSLSKDKKAKTDRSKQNIGADTYNAWEKDFEDKLESGFFNDYDVICFDSLTTFSDLVMDGILAINGRGGQWPSQDDYAPQMLVIKNVFRTVTSMGKAIYVAAHCQPMQDDLSKRVFNQILVTGQLRQRLPLLFSEFLHLEVQSDGKGKVNYNVQTKPDRMFPSVRTSIKGLKFLEDITLDFSKPLEGQGLGGLIF